jgi:pimeloyl-ACP methyl ester carboxylesterase
MDTSHTRPDRVEPAAAALGQQVVRQGGTALLVEIQKSAGPSPTETAAHLRMIAADPAYDEWSTSKTLAMAGAAWAGLVDDIVDQPDRLDALRSLDVPTLVIAGEQDLGFLPQSRAIAEAIPGARFEVIPDGGHSPQFESPEAWWTALTAFLDQLPA